MNKLIIERIQESFDVKQRMLEDKSLLENIEKISDKIVETIVSGHKLVICGNGGSASDSLHFAGEIVGRFQRERIGWPAIVLNSDVATMTAIANDYGYDNIFARQAQAHLNSGDIFIGISTSGNSENILRAINVARERETITAALLGKGGGKIKDVVDYPLVIPCNLTARIQECHILIIHILCELVEEKLR